MAAADQKPGLGPVAEVFADGLLDIGYGNGVVRLDLFSLSATQRDAEGQPVPEIRQRVIMTLPGFVNCLAAMEGMLRQLRQAGVVAPATIPATAAPAADKGPRSPNFG